MDEVTNVTRRDSFSQKKNDRNNWARLYRSSHFANRSYTVTAPSMFTVPAGMYDRDTRGKTTVQCSKYYRHLSNGCYKIKTILLEIATPNKLPAGVVDL
jgi:hypothetical protein